ncbi:MAG: 50S ribosomal protein L28 [Rickettsiales bacterium]|jgi:large subunit ribosomal protein L28|nr:50S ribosomal protein L28 [Rickettsiales bacterium]
MSRSCDLAKVSVLFGHKVSHSEIKTSRKFLPNLQHVSLMSDALGVKINFRLAARTLRSVSKYGSLDSFLVNFGYSGLSPLGKKIRKKVIKKLTKSGELEKISLKKTKGTPKKSE